MKLKFNFPKYRKIRAVKFSMCALILTALNSWATTPRDSVVLRAETDPHLKYPEQIQRKKLLDRQKVFTLGDKDSTSTSSDSIRVLMDIFYTDQYHTVNDPEAPYFMFMTKDAKLAMGIGGAINIRGWEDWDGVVNAFYFMPYEIPIPKNPAKNKRLYGTPGNTGLFFTLLGRNTIVGDFSAYIQGMFNGYNRINFKLTRAFLTLRGFTVGYDYSTFLDVDALPRLVDAGLYGGSIDRANVLIRYRHKFKDGWSIAGGVEFPKTDISDVEPDVEASFPFLPDITGFGQYQWNQGYSHLRLSGMIRTLSYRNLLQDKNHNVVGWGLALSTVVKVIPSLTFYGICSYGKGHGGYISDMSNGMHDLVGIYGHPGELEAPRAFSYFVALKYHYRPDLYSTVTFTQIRNYETYPIDSNGYKYGMSGSANLFWEITPRLSLGGEYMIGKRKNFDGQFGIANRAEMSFRLSF